ncbi:MAG: hypothetical protein R6V20_05280 [Desulfobia sp.]
MNTSMPQDSSFNNYFTLPEQLRDLAWKNQKTVYSLMFAAVQDFSRASPKTTKSSVAQRDSPPYFIPGQGHLTIIRTSMSSCLGRAST